MIKMKIKYEVIGLRIEQFVGQSVSGHNCDFEYSPEVFVKHILLLKDRSGYKYEYSLWQTEGECGSGWCSATFGESELRQVNNFASKTHRIIQQTFIEEDLTKNIDNNVFSISYDGGDQWYPSGGYQVNMNLFQKLDRELFENRPVVIFQGESNCLKSHLAASTNKEIFETDSLDSINDLNVITADIIVIGNKHKDITIDKIKPFIFGNYSLIIADFSSGGSSNVSD